MAAQQALQCYSMEASGDEKMLKHACLVQHFMSLTVYLRNYCFLRALCASSEAGVR